MISEAEALERILAQTFSLDEETAPLSAADGRVCPRDVFATLPLPPFDHAAMDGYAIHESDCGVSGRHLEVIGEQAAGAKNFALRVCAGKCVRIFTGAPVPEGIGAVVMQEDVDRTGDGIRVREAARPGEFMRRRGGDLAVGQKIFAKGAAWHPTALGVAASQGLAVVPVIRRPGIIIASTGSELRQPGETLQHAGEIFNTNATVLEALLLRHGAESLEKLSLSDDLNSLTQGLGAASQRCDVLVIAGGMSVGDHDLVRPALQEAGAAVDFWRVAVKPGKPFLFGRAGRALIFGLPGNPVSAFVTALLFVVPALRKLAGRPHQEIHHRFQFASLSVPLVNPDNRTAYLRGNFNAAADEFVLQCRQESHALFSLSQANALARVEPNCELPEGAEIPVLPM